MSARNECHHKQLHSSSSPVVGQYLIKVETYAPAIFDGLQNKVIYGVRVINLAQESISSKHVPQGLDATHSLTERSNNLSKGTVSRCACLGSSLQYLFLLHLQGTGRLSGSKGE